MTKDEALKLALEAFDSMIGRKPERVEQAITAIKEALAQVEQEPVAWISATELLVMRGNALGGAKDWRVNLGLEPEEGDVGLYTIPLQRIWVGLTGEDKESFWTGDQMSPKEWDELYAEVEAKLREKNR